jgi:transposase
MRSRLRKEEVVTIGVLAEKGQTNAEIARTMGVTEGAVRYHVRRAADGATDRRRNKPAKADVLGEVIRAWVALREGPRPVNVRELHEHLVTEHGYEGSSKSVLRWVRSHYPPPKIRTYRRVETPPGAQTQTDWAEYPRVDLGEGPEELSALVMVLSHSRMPSVVWSRAKDELSWLAAHNGSFRRLAGVAAVNRIDNVKTAIAKGAGAWGTINPTYRSYARAVGFHIDACGPRRPFEKGKTEAKVKLSRLLLDVEGRRYDGFEGLQDWTDRRVRRWAERAICPATGRTVVESWERELPHLAPLPILPEPFDIAVERPVSTDCLVSFEGRSYTVPFGYADQVVEVRGCAGTVQILAGGGVVREYPRGTEERLLLDPTCYEGKATDRVLPPPPLGRMGRRLQEIAQMPVEERPIDLYAALAEVAR